MRELGGTPILAQAINGRNVFRKLLAMTEAEPPVPTPVFLDFSEVEVATASFLRESVLAFRDAVRGRRSNLYPIVANTNEAVRDELVEVLRFRGDVLMVCTLENSGVVSDLAPLGELDPKQRLTFELVSRHGETDAGELMRLHGDNETVQRTAWNNRLAALAGLGLVMEISQGRAKRYKPLLLGT